MSSPQVVFGRRRDGGPAGLAPCSALWQRKAPQAFPRASTVRAGGRRRASTGAVVRESQLPEGRVGDRRGVRMSSSWPLHRRVHAESSEFGRRNRRLWRWAGASASETRRSPSEHYRPCTGNPRQGYRSGNPGASETPLRVRDNRSRGVSGLRVGCRKSVSDARFQQVPPVAAGGAHGNLARGQSPRRQRRKPAAPEAPTESEKASSVITSGTPSVGRGENKGLVKGSLLAADAR